MKHFILLLGFLSIGFFSKAQYISNGSFETWGTYDPIGWKSPDSILASLGFVNGTVSQSTTDFYSGLSSAKLETKTFIIYAVPGILTNGNIVVNTAATPPASVVGGKPFTQRPESFTGYYKYTPASGDACVLAAFLLKRNGSVVDTIGYAQFTNTSAVSSWTQFSATFTYASLDYPDTIQISLFSSNPTAAITGSILMVDNLNLEGGTLGINKYGLLSSINVFPNPASDLLNIHFNQEIKNSTSVCIYSVVGKKMKEIILPAGTEFSSINIRDLNKGMYFIQILSGKDKYTKKISVE